jgi:hypothetical protein
MNSLETTKADNQSVDSFHDVESSSETLDLLQASSTSRIYEVNTFLSKILKQYFSNCYLRQCFYSLFVLQAVCLFIDFVAIVMLYDVPIGVVVSYDFLSYNIVPLVYMIFEFETTLRTSKLLKIQKYEFHLLIVVFWTLCIVCELILVYNYSAKVSLSWWLILLGWVFYLSYFPLYLIHFLMSNEIGRALLRIKKHCSVDESISLATYEVMNDKTVAMRNTTKFYSRLSNLHKVMEFKLLVQLLFGLWYVIHCIVYPIPFIDILIPLQIIFGMMQPITLQYIIEQIESKTKVNFTFAIKVLNVKISNLMLILPLISFITAIVKFISLVR